MDKKKHESAIFYEESIYVVFTIQKAQNRGELRKDGWTSQKQYATPTVSKELRALGRVFGLLYSQKLKVTLQHFLWKVLLDE